MSFSDLIGDAGSKKVILLLILREFYFHKMNSRNWGATVAQAVVPDYGLDDWGSIPDRGRGFFF
jgi:hypothetical protein